MRAGLLADDGRQATPIDAVDKPAFAAWRHAQDEPTRAWLRRTGFAADAGAFAWLPGADTAPARLVAGLGEAATLQSLGDLPYKLPQGDYRLRLADESVDGGRLALGWGLGAYRFTAYRAPKRPPARLLVNAEHTLVLQQVDAVTLCRDLINTPASDMLPRQLETASRALADVHGADATVTTGDDLLQRGLRTIHAVGRASASPPRLIDLRWGDPGHPKVTLVGKGVCFDSGGLDLKSASNMRLMKKDMGGAAHALALAQLVMARQLPVRLRVLVPAVENAVAGNAFRPGDVIRTYQGLTVEVDNTDAEGRLVLADALAVATEEDPELLVDFATLTGAARTALGTELPALFATDDAIAVQLMAIGADIEDPVWRMPLFAPYRKMLKSEVADLVNSPPPPYAGAIAAALFLERFAGDGAWLHFDIMAWNLTARPGHPVGGEAMGLRAMHAYLERRWGV